MFFFGLDTNDIGPRRYMMPSISRTKIDTAIWRCIIFQGYSFGCGIKGKGKDGTLGKAFVDGKVAK